MKIALIGDVHANLPALDAVLSDAHKRGVEAIWNVGDLVGYGAFPDEVVKVLQQENVLSIIGNYDVKVLKVKEKKDEWKTKTPPEKWFAFNWAYDKLSEPSREYLGSLPEEKRFEIEGKNILLTHGSPASNEESIKTETPDERLKELLDMANANMIISGHSHQLLKKKFSGVWFINPGSVGRPDDGDPRASYAIMQIRYRFFQLRHYRVEYDVEKAVSAIRDSNLPEEFAQMILQGRGLDAILKAESANKDRVKESTISSTDQTKALDSALRLAESCNYDVEHSRQVTQLALKLFDELAPVHNLGPDARFWLNIGSLLHDIGWIEGQKSHHKTALRTILNTRLLSIGNRERLIVGSIARYHRKVNPSKKHSHYAALKSSERNMIKVLAAILRVADGMDRSHQSIVKDLSCEITPDQVIIKCSVNHPSEIDRQYGLKKGKLLEKVLKRDLIIEFQIE